VGYLETIGAALGNPLKIIGTQFISVIPKIFYSAIVIIFGYFLGWILGTAVEHVLKRMKFDARFSKLHLAQPLEKIKISKLLGWVVKWYTFVVFAAAGASYIELYPVTNIVSTFAQWFPSLILAMGIGIVGAIFAEYVHKMILHVKTKEVKIMANITKYFILVIVLIMALDQVIDISVLEQVLLIMVGGIAIGIALAIGISVGLALKDEATGWITGFKKQ